MNESELNHMKTTATTEAVSLPPEEKWHWIQQWRRNTTCAGQKPRSDWKNDSQIQGAGRKSRKSPTPFVGIKPYGKSQVEGFPMGQHTYNSVGGVKRTVRRFTTKLAVATQWRFDQEE
jgi:hypothetical protein